MLEMLKARKEQLQARGEKGFTLMEMLIVIAIIAILIAIAIPIFTAQLERAHESTDAANLRSAYATASAVMLTDTSTAEGVSAGPVAITQTEDWEYLGDELIGTVKVNTSPTSGDAYVNVSKAGVISITDEPSYTPAINPVTGK